MEVYKLTRNDQSNEHPLGSMPLTIISANPNYEGRFSNIKLSTTFRLRSNGQDISIRVANTDNHFIQITEPWLVVDSIIEVITMIRIRGIGRETSLTGFGSLPGRRGLSMC